MNTQLRTHHRPLQMIKRAAGRRGVTLVETLLTLVILTTALFAFSSLLVSTMRTMRYSARSAAATTYAAGWLEKMRTGTCASTAGSENVMQMSNAWASAPTVGIAELRDSIT